MHPCDKAGNGEGRPCPTEAERRADTKEGLAVGAACVAGTVAILGAGRVYSVVDYELWRRKRRNKEA